MVHVYALDTRSLFSGKKHLKCVLNVFRSIQFHQTRSEFMFDSDDSNSEHNASPPWFLFSTTPLPHLRKSLWKSFHLFFPLCPCQVGGTLDFPFQSRGIPLLTSVLSLHFVANLLKWSTMHGGDPNLSFQYHTGEPT